MPDPIPIRRLKLLRSLRRVGEALDAWDRLDALRRRPRGKRGDPRAWPTVPKLNREQLESLRAELVAALGEQVAGSDSP